MKRLYYRAMKSFTEQIAWQLFWLDPANRASGAFYEASDHYKRKLSMLDHPSNGR